MTVLKLFCVLGLFAISIMNLMATDIQATTSTSTTNITNTTLPTTSCTVESYVLTIHKTCAFFFQWPGSK